jgi:hypothetical protein
MTTVNEQVRYVGAMIGSLCAPEKTGCKEPTAGEGSACELLSGVRALGQLKKAIKSTKSRVTSKQTIGHSAIREHPTQK